MSAAICRKKRNATTTTVQFACKLLFLCHSTEPKLWSIGEETRTPIHLGWPRCELNSKLDFKKKDEVSTVKSQTEQNTLENHIARHTRTRLRSEMHWKMLLYLDFRSYFEATGPNCFNVFWKVLLQSIFLARIISWRPKQAKKISQLERSRHSVARQSWIPNQKKERSMTEAKLQRCSLLTMTSRCWAQLGRCHDCC